jgi:glycosyltransferase involved in cell wall biosynthesis
VRREEARAATRRPRIAYISYSTGIYDARTLRMADAALRAGYDVTVYARWEAGLPVVEERDGFRIIRAPVEWRLAVPGLRGGARRRLAAAMAADAAALASSPAGGERETGGDQEAGDGADGSRDGARSARASRVGRLVLLPARLAARVIRRLRRPLLRWRRLVIMFPLRPMGWAEALDDVTEPADIWHGMWAGSLAALARARARHGGRTIYDSRDVYLLSRDFYRLERPIRAILARFERRWAQAADRVLTVNEPYADILARELRVPRPAVVMNCPERWTPPDPPPDFIREALGLDPGTRVVLYQGQLIPERGIEQAMEAILQVPDAVLVLLGYGAEDRYRTRAATAPYAGRVFLLPAVLPSELLAWTASADVMVMPIQPSTLNHRFTTPQKLFEAIAAGVPVVASDLPGMAGVVRAAGAGELCDPTSPPSIAAAIRAIVDLPTADRAALRDRIRAAAHDRYSWETEAAGLFGLYAGLGPVPVATLARAPS